MEYFLLLDKHLPEGVGINMYGPEHIGWLIAGAAICVLLCLAYRRADEAGRPAGRPAAPRRSRYAPNARTT